MREGQVCQAPTTGYKYCTEHSKEAKRKREIVSQEEEGVHSEV